MTKFVICCIVKNESKIIERCLTQFLSIANAICITDTGSTDNTIELIEKFGKDNNIITKVPTNTFKSFGYNRSESFIEAKKFITETYGEEELKNWYALLPDADMIFINKSLEKQNLTEPGYLLIQTTDTLDYSNIRIIRLSDNWKCVGRTHEYWTGEKSINLGKNICYFDDKNDGGCKSDKYERDIRLLLLDIKDNPKSDRAHFYLAQSYSGINEIDKSIEYYKKHNELKDANFGYKYMAYLRIGESYELLYNREMSKIDKETKELSELNEANKLWALAMQYYNISYIYSKKERVEGICKIAEHYYDVDKNLSYEYGLIVANAEYPKWNSLFIQKDVYSYKGSNIVAIQGYYANYREDSLKHTDILTIKSNIPNNIIQSSYNFLQYYDIKLKSIFDKKIDIPLEEDYVSSNPSICQASSEGYFCNCRSVNYKMDDKGNYSIKDNNWDNKKDINYLVIYDNNYNQTSVTKLLCDSKEQRFNHIEDCRIFTFKNNIYVTSTYMDNIFKGTPRRIALYKIKNNKIIHLKDFDEYTLCEKNWLPFANEDKINFMYNHSIILEYDIKTKKINDKYNYEYDKYDLSRLRGGAGPIKLNNNLNLVITHEVFYKDNLRNYYHRFLLLDKDYKIIKISRVFKFGNEKVEFCAGLSKCWNEESILITYGVMDREARICKVSINDVMLLMK